MTKPEAQLVENLFDPKINQKPTRDGYGDGLVIAGSENPNIVVLCADLTESTRSLPFAQKFPERFVEMGVAEQNMAAVAAGMGVSGKCVFIASYAMFSPGRNWEQIRTTICYNDSNVKIAGAHSGLSVGPDGATHQAIEDMAITRVIPNMKVIAPCDMIETKKATIAVTKFYGPAYLRFAREKSPVFTTEETPFEIGRAEIFWEPKEGLKPEVAIVGCGPLVYKALVAAKEFEGEGIGAIVVNNHSIKPIDEKTIVEVAQRCGAVVTVEEHQLFCGMGSAVSEVLAQKYPVPIEFVAVADQFGQSGQPEELLEHYGLGVKDIKERVKKVIKRKNSEPSRF